MTTCSKTKLFIAALLVSVAAVGCKGEAPKTEEKPAEKAAVPTKPVEAVKTATKTATAAAGQPAH